MIATLDVSSRPGALESSRPNALEARTALPRTWTTVLLTVAVVASLAPSLLPRSSLTQSLLTGTLCALALAMSALVHRIARNFSPRPCPRMRRVALLPAAALMGVAVVSATRWQNTLRTAMGVDTTSVVHWVEVVYGSVSVCAGLVVIAVGTVRSVRRRTVRKAIAVVVLCVCTAGALVSGCDDAVSDATQSPVPSASAEAMPSNQLGREGQRFVSGSSDGRAVRAYVPLVSESTAEARALSAVDRLEHAGGFTKSRIVVAVPTGSGWVDENAVHGWEESFDGDVATIAVQYSDRPSWITFLLAREQATRSAALLVDALAAYLGRMPESERPDLLIYGQSLGSIGGSEALADRTGDVCGALWAGPPAGRVGTTAAAPPTVVLANSSDPVVWWSTDLLLAPPNLSRARVDAPVPTWLPILSYLQTSVDMLSALDAPDGHGHRYGTDQGTSLPTC